MKPAVATALGLLVALAGCGPGVPRPNLLLVTVDTLRADRLACYGGPADVGRSICALAASGTRFQWAFSTAPTTAPSVASILSSLYPVQHRLNQNVRSFLGAEIVTLAEVLHEAGYHTAAFVSNPVLRRVRRLDQGFDVYDQQMERRESNRRFYVERHARATTDAALAFANGPARAPWFLWVHYQDPHGPYRPPGAPPARDARGGAKLRRLDDDTGRGGIPAYQVQEGARTRETYERRYLAEIRFVDQEVGRLLRRLDALGEPPVVLLTADHGEALGEDDYFFAHGHSVGLDQIRVPLVLRPSVGEAVVDTPVSLVDVAPTLLHRAGLPLPDAFVGRPLGGGPDSPDGERASPNGERALFAEATRRMAVVRGSAYYARDRYPDATTAPGGRAWSDAHPTLPARTAALEGDAAPAYTPEDGAPPAELEASLVRFLEANPYLPGHEHPRVPADVREQLRALGYTQEE